MKKIYCFLITISFLIFTISPSQAQTTEGTEFWLTFGRATALVPSDVDLQIRIVAKNHKTWGTIFFTNLNTTIYFEIEPRQVYTHVLSEIERVAVYNMQPTGVYNRSVYITSTSPVSVYAASLNTSSLDATNILPVTALNTAYHHISYTSVVTTTDGYAIIATKDNTVVYQNTIPVATLPNKGDVYYKTGAPNMIGDFISSDSDKPIALFTLARSFIINSPPVFSQGQHLFQQMAPITTWGKNFFVPVSASVQDVVRIVVSQNNTNIKQIGGTILSGDYAQTTLENLQAGQFVELKVPLSSSGCYIRADKPVGVGAFYADNPPYGGAAMAWLPPIEQSVTNALIAPFISSGPFGSHSHYAVVLTPTATRNDTKVSIGGGLPVDLNGGNWIENDTAKMSFYKMPLTNATASYYFTNPAGLIILCYGYDNIQSYYYLAGSAMRNLAAFTANNIPYIEMSDHIFCEHDITFIADVQGIHPNAGSLNWYIDNVHQQELTDLLTWNQHFATGEYAIKMTVLFVDESTETYESTLKVGCEANFYANNVHNNLLEDTVFCNKTVHFYAEIENFSATQDNLKWYIDGNEYIPAQGKMQWSKDFETGEYEIKMVTLFENGETATLVATLKMEVFWIKMRNVRY